MKKLHKLIFSIVVPIVMIVSCSFVFAGVNKTAYAANGGAMYIGANSSFTLEGKKNISGFTANNGGAINVAGGTLNINGGNIFGNTATLAGGAIGVTSSGKLVMTAGAISGNECSTTGGGIYIYNGSADISGGTISDNKAQNGGGLYICTSSTIANATISGNTAGNYGGGLAVAGGTVTIKNVTFSNNTALSGSGVYVYDSATLQIDGATFTNNTCQTSGVIRIETGGVCVINDCVVTNNVVSGAAVSSNGTLTINGGFYAYNESSNGNTINNGKGVLNLYGGHVIGNVTTATGVLNLKKEAIIDGNLKVGNTGTIVLEDYDGTHKSYNIVTEENRTGVIMTFNGSSVKPDLSKINISGYDTEKYEPELVKNNGVWSISIVEKTYNYDSEVTIDNTLLTKFMNVVGMGIIDYIETMSFDRVAPDEFTKYDLSMDNGIDIYFNESKTAVSLVFPGTIYTAEDISQMFTPSSVAHRLKRIILNNFNTSKTVYVDKMFYNCNYLEYLDMSACDFSSVMYAASTFEFSDALMQFKTPINCTMSFTVSAPMTLYNQDTSLAVTSFKTILSSMTIVSNLVGKAYFSNTWKTMIASSSYMTTTIDPTKIELIRFTDSVPYGYALAGTLPYNINVYQKTSSSLVSVAFVSSSVIYAPVDSSGLFSQLTSLTKINFDNFDTSDVEYMNTMFFKDSALASLDLTKFDTAKVKNMYRTFGGCTTLGTITFGESWNTSNVETFNGTFLTCDSLKEIDLSKFDTSKATTIRGMFNECKALTSLDLSTFDTSHVNAMDYMFRNAWRLESVKFGENFTTKRVTNMSSMFDGCQSLKKIDLSRFDTRKVTDVRRMFYDCKSLLKYDLSNFDLSSVTDVVSMLKVDCILELKTPINSPIAIAIETNSTLSYNGSVVTQVPANSSVSMTYVATNTVVFSDQELKQLIYDAFNAEFIDTLAEISFEYSMTDSMVQDRNYDYYQLNNGVKAYYVRGWDEANGERKVILVYNGIIKTGTSCVEMFANLTKLEKASFNNFDTSAATDMYGMFYGCKSMKYLDLSNFDMSNVTNANDMLVMESDLEVLMTPKRANKDTFVDFVVNNPLYRPSGRVVSSRFTFPPENSMVWTSTPPSTFTSSAQTKQQDRDLEIFSSVALICIGIVASPEWFRKKNRLK